MDSIEKLRFLADKENGLGIPLTVLSKKTGCHASTLRHYINGESVPTERLNVFIEAGINELYSMMKEKIGE